MTMNSPSSRPSQIMAKPMKNVSSQRIVFACAAVLAGVLSPALLAAAQAADMGEAATAASKGPTRTLQLGVGKSIIVDLPADANEIYVADPKIANAIVRSARRLYVTGIANGDTTIFAMTKDGRQLAAIQISVGRDISKLVALFAAAIPNNDIHVQTVSGSIVLTGSIANAREAQMAVDIAGGFINDAVTAVSTGSVTAFTSPQYKVINSLTIRGLDQVSVHVLVSEVRRDVAKQLGVDLSGAVGGNRFSASGHSSNTSNFPLNGIQNASQAALSWFAGGSSLTSTIQAFEQQGVARTLAEPTVTAISGETAKFLAGGTVPVEQSYAIDPSGVRTVHYIQTPYGVTLNFTPVVLSEGRIQLHVSTEVTDIDYTNNVSGLPGFKTRKNETTVELPSGGSIVTAGLISTHSAQAVSGMPGLMNLPVLGALFRSRDFLREESELLIVVTPYIVHAIDPKQGVRPDQNFNEASDPQSWLLGRVNRIYSPAGADSPTPNYTGKVGFIND